jgi:hypothetical protein
MQGAKTMTTATDKIIYKTVDHYTFADYHVFSTRGVDHLSVQIRQGSETACFYVLLICRLPHDGKQRVLADRLVIFNSREEMLVAYEAA